MAGRYTKEQVRQRVLRMAADGASEDEIDAYVSIVRPHIADAAPATTMPDLPPAYELAEKKPRILPDLEPVEFPVINNVRNSEAPPAPVRLPGAVVTEPVKADAPPGSYEKSGHRVIDTSGRTADGRVPTHRLDQPTNRLPDESFEDYEKRVLARTTWSPDTAAIRDMGALEPDVQDPAQRLLADANRAGVRLGVAETRRRQERQEMIFQKGRSRPGPVATWTLTSDHTPGRAVDFTGDQKAYAWLQENAPKYGFKVMGAMDPGHVAMPDSTPTVDVQSHGTDRTFGEEPTGFFDRFKRDWEADAARKRAYDEANPGLFDEFGKAVTSSLAGAGTAAVGHMLDAGGVPGARKVIDVGEGISERNAPRVPSMKAAHTAGDWWNYAQSQAGQALGSTIPSIIGYMAGGIPAAAIASYVQNTGDIRGELEDLGVNGPKKEAIAFILGVPIAALDMLPIEAVGGMIKKKLAGIAAEAVAGEAAPSILKEGAKAAGMGILTEAPTEAAQEAIQYAGTRVGAGQPVVPAEMGERAAEAAVAGGLGGALLGGGSGAAAAAIDRRSRAQQILQPPAATAETAGEIPTAMEIPTNVNGNGTKPALPPLPSIAYRNTSFGVDGAQYTAEPPSPDAPGYDTSEANIAQGVDPDAAKAQGFDGAQLPDGSVVVWNTRKLKPIPAPPPAATEPPADEDPVVVAIQKRTDIGPAEKAILGEQWKKQRAALEEEAKASTAQRETQTARATQEYDDKVKRIQEEEDQVRAEIDRRFAETNPFVYDDEVHRRAGEWWAKLSGVERGDVLGDDFGPRWRSDFPDWEKAPGEWAAVKRAVLRGYGQRFGDDVRAELDPNIAAWRAMSAEERRTLLSKAGLHEVSVEQNLGEWKTLQPGVRSILVKAATETSDKNGISMPLESGAKTPQHRLEETRKAMEVKPTPRAPVATDADRSAARTAGLMDARAGDNRNPYRSDSALYQEYEAGYSSVPADDVGAFNIAKKPPTEEGIKQLERQRKEAEIEAQRPVAPGDQSAQSTAHAAGAEPADVGQPGTVGRPAGPGTGGAHQDASAGSRPAGIPASESAPPGAEEARPAEAAAATVRDDQGRLRRNLKQVPSEAIADEVIALGEAIGADPAAPTLVPDENMHTFNDQRAWVGMKGAAMRAAGRNKARAQAMKRLVAEIERRGENADDVLEAAFERMMERKAITDEPSRPSKSDTAEPGLMFSPRPRNVNEGPDLFGERPATASASAQQSMFSEREGTAAARDLKRTERAARNELEKLRQQLAANPGPVAQTRIYQRIAELERLVNRGQKISAGELTSRSAADRDVEAFPANRQNKEPEPIATPEREAHHDRTPEWSPHRLFDDPEAVERLQERVKQYVAQRGWMAPEEAQERIARWKKHALSQRGDPRNAQKVVLSLFDLTGAWAQPWIDAGYQVYTFDIQRDPNMEDVNKFSTEFFNDQFGAFDGMDIHAILAACPCTDFAVSGARHFAAKDADGRTEASIELVRQTMRTIEHFRPAMWAIENPVGRMEKLAGLPPWRLSFDPNHVGDPYTKKTLLWGRFNTDLPIAPVEPTEGSKMHQQYGGKSQRTKNARSVTPEGFAYSFFMANNVIDHPATALQNEYDRLDKKLVADAVAAGIDEAKMGELIDDLYYIELDDQGAEAALREAVDGKKPDAPAKPAEAEGETKHEFSSTQFDLPSEAAAQIRAIAAQIPKDQLGEDGAEDTPHITVKFGLHADDAGELRKLLESQGPITVRFAGITHFPASQSSSGDVVKIDIESAELRALNKKISDALPHTDTHPGYKPHATIAYVKKGLGAKVAAALNNTLEGQELTFGTLRFSDKNENATEIPLGDIEDVEGEGPAGMVRNPQEDTTEFKQWFGESKVVDGSGRPLRVYHGTTEDFDTFAVSRTGQKMGNKYGRGAIFFTSNPTVASDYATVHEELDEGHPLDRPNVMPVYLSLQNPLILDAAGRSWASFDKEIAGARQKGFDGVILRKVLDHARARGERTIGPVDVFVAFRREQIKSATGNRGTFDPDVPSIIGSVAPDPLRSDDVIGVPSTIGNELSGELTRDPSTEGLANVSAPEVMEALADVTEAAGERITQRVGRMGTGANVLGWWSPRKHVIRTKTANDIAVASHEVAHALETLLFGEQKGGPWKLPRADRPMQKELARIGFELYGKTKPAAGYKREGWAEFIRMWVTQSTLQGNPVDVAVKAPIVHRWFETQFAKDFPDVRKKLELAREQARIWRFQGARARAEASIVDTGSLGNRAKAVGQTVKKVFSMEKLVEMAQPLYALARESELNLGRKLLPSEDPFFTLSALRTTHDARTRYMVENAMIDLAGNRVGPALNEIRSLVKNRRTDFMIYLWARRALKLVADPRGRRNPGLSRADAGQIVKELGSPAFELAAAKVYGWNNGVLDYAAQASPTFAHVVHNVRLRDPGDYIPLQREFDDMDADWTKMGGTAGATKRSPVKRLKGSGRRIKDPFPIMLSQTSKTLRQAHERLVLDQIIKISGIPGMGQIIEEVPVDQRPAAHATIEELIERINKMLFDAQGPGAHLLQLGTDQQMTQPVPAGLMQQALTFFAPVERPDGKDPIIPIYDRGKVRWFQVDGKLYDTLKSLDVYRMGDVGGLPILEWIFGKPASIARAGTTGLRASFGLIWNPLKDFQTFSVNTRLRNKTAATLFARWMKGWSQMALARTVGAVTGKHSEMVDLWIRLGGEMAQPLGQDIQHTRRAARRLFAGRAVRTIDPRNGFDFYRDLVQFPEGAGRVAEVEAVAKEVGWKPGQPMTLDQSLEILLASKQVTTDFTAAGEFGRVMNRMAPFHNAAIQGPRAHLRAARRDPMLFAWRGLQLALPTLLLWWHYKDEDWWKELDLKERFLHWHFPFTNPFNGRKELLRIPRAFEVGMIFAALPEMLMDAWYRHEPEQVKEWFKTLGEVALPNVEPTLLSVAREQWKNRQWPDRPIVPTGFERKPKEEQFNEYTTRAAIEIGRVFQASPMRIDHAIHGLGGPFALDVIGALGLGPEDVHRQKELADAPVVGRLFQRGGQAGIHPKQIDDLYELIRVAELKQNSDRNPETREERKHRLQLEDAGKAVSALILVRRFKASYEERAALTRAAKEIAERAVQAAEAGRVDRPEFGKDRKRSQLLKKRTEHGLPTAIPH